MQSSDLGLETEQHGWWVVTREGWQLREERKRCASSSAGLRLLPVWAPSSSANLQTRQDGLQGSPPVVGDRGAGDVQPPQVPQALEVLEPRIGYPGS